MDPSTSPPRIDQLSRLPNELLHQIFNDVYLDRKRGAKEGINPKKLTGPLSKRLLDFQRGGLYRNVEIGRWMGPKSFAVLVGTVNNQPHLGSIVETLRFDISQEIHHVPQDDHLELTGPTIKAFFKLLPNLRRLTLAGGISKDGTVLQIYSTSSTALHVLSLLLDNPKVVSLSNESSITRGSHWEKFMSMLNPQSSFLVEFNKLHSSGISRLAIFPRDTKYQAFGNHADELPSNFVTFRFCQPTPHLLSSSPSPKSSALAEINHPFARQLFSQLEKVTFEGETSEISSPLLEVLPRFPIKDLTLQIINVVPIFPLLRIVSQCPAIAHLTLHYHGYPGLIGTRVSTINFDKIFPTIDPDTEDLAQDAMPDDWRYSHLPPSWPLDDLLCLREKAVEAGIELDAESLFDAIEVQQAFREDTQLLDELWQEWKEKSQKKPKKGGKTRRSKK